MSSPILAIDPGPEMSASALLIDGVLEDFSYLANEAMLDVLENVACRYHRPTLVIEQIKAMGMSVGAEVFETVFWSGRFAQYWQVSAGTGGPLKWDRIGRMDVKMHLCNSSRAKDKNVRQALVDRFSDGRGEKAAKGTKAKPGPLYGVSGDVWAALAVAVTYWDTKVMNAKGVRLGHPIMDGLLAAVGATDQVLTTLTRKS